jgi:hypothetical protein
MSAVWYSFVLFTAAALAATPQPVPKVILVYPGPSGSMLDQLCPDLTKGQIDPRLVRETVERLREFQSLWDKEGVPYLEAVLSEVGINYPFRDVQVSLTVCSVVPSMGSPLLVQMRPFLSGTEEQPRPAALFPMYVFHELMHRYATPVRDVSQLRKKYKAEPVRVLNQLHVVALEKLALMKLGRLDILRSWEQLNREDRTPAHQRAWDIVSAESYQRFIEELKLLRR